MISGLNCSISCRISLYPSLVDEIMVGMLWTTICQTWTAFCRAVANGSRVWMAFATGIRDLRRVSEIVVCGVVELSD